MIVDLILLKKQKLCAHEYNFVKSQERAFALIVFSSVQQTNFITKQENTKKIGLPPN